MRGHTLTAIASAVALALLAPAAASAARPHHHHHAAKVHQQPRHLPRAHHADVNETDAPPEGASAETVDGVCTGDQQLCEIVALEEAPAFIAEREQMEREPWPAAEAADEASDSVG